MNILEEICVHVTPWENFPSIQKQIIYSSCQTNAIGEIGHTGAYHVPLDPNLLEPGTLVPYLPPMTRLNNSRRTLYFVIFRVNNVLRECILTPSLCSLS